MHEHYSTLRVIDIQTSGTSETLKLHNKLSKLLSPVICFGLRGAASGVQGVWVVLDGWVSRGVQVCSGMWGSELSS
jgi:hypothetical protein